jgi:hypothetical protein
LFKLLLRPSVPVQPNTNLEETFYCTSFVFISYYIILLIMYLFSLFYLGADTPVYLAMLPAGTNSPKGNFVSDRTIQNWGWLSNRLWKEYCYLALIKKSHCIVVFAHQLQNLMYKIIVPPWGGGSFKGLGGGADPSGPVFKSGLQKWNFNCKWHESLLVLQIKVFWNVSNMIHRCKS